MTPKYRGFTFALAKSHGYSSNANIESFEDFPKLKFVLFTVLTFFIIPFQYCCALARSGDEWHTKEFKPLTLTDSVHALAV